MGDASNFTANGSTNGNTNGTTGNNTGPISDLPQPRRYITGHNDEGKAVVHSQNDFAWESLDSGKLAFSVAYTTSASPADLNSDVDIAEHHRVLSTGKLGLVNPRGSVFRYVDFAPGYACGMHRTQSIDYGIVLEGQVDMVLDSGEVVQSMKRGDVAVQRGTQHQWVNRSETQWARMIFVLLDCKPLVVDGEVLKEDLGSNIHLPPSGNDN